MAPATDFTTVAPCERATLFYAADQGRLHPQRPPEDVLREILTS
jgi:hypothetical protein